MTRLRCLNNYEGQKCQWSNTADLALDCHLQMISLITVMSPVPRVLDDSKTSCSRHLIELSASALCLLLAKHPLYDITAGVLPSKQLRPSCYELGFEERRGSCRSLLGIREFRRNSAIARPPHKIQVVRLLWHWMVSRLLHQDTRLGSVVRSDAGFLRQSMTNALCLTSR